MACIRYDKGRTVVAICHNSDVGDAWEWTAKTLVSFTGPRTQDVLSSALANHCDRGEPS
jgi:hypothetical protein